MAEMDQWRFSVDKSTKSRQSEMAFETGGWPASTSTLKRDKMAVTCWRLVITSLAELTNWMGEILCKTDPLKSMEAEAMKCGRESTRKKKMNVKIVFLEYRTIVRTLIVSLKLWFCFVYILFEEKTKNERKGWRLFKPVLKTFF